MINTQTTLKNIIKHIADTLEKDVDNIKEQKDEMSAYLYELTWNEYIRIILSAEIKEITISLTEIMLQDLINFKDQSIENIIKKGNKLTLLFRKILILL